MIQRLISFFSVDSAAERQTVFEDFLISDLADIPLSELQMCELSYFESIAQNQSSAETP